MCLENKSDVKCAPGPALSPLLICVCVCVYLYVCLCMYVYAYAYMCMFVCMYVCMYVYVCVDVRNSVIILVNKFLLNFSDVIVKKNIFSKENEIKKR